MSDAALEVEGVSYGYTRAVKALDQVGFTVPRGEFTALLGPNGAGKTTLMALITHLFSAEAGRIAVCGHDLRHAPRAALAAMGVVFQRPTLDLDLSVDAEPALRGGALRHGPAGRADRGGADPAAPARPRRQQGAHAQRRHEAPGRDRPGAAASAAPAGPRRAHGRPRYREPARDRRACARLVPRGGSGRALGHASDRRDRARRPGRAAASRPRARHGRHRRGGGCRRCG